MRKTSGYTTPTAPVPSFLSRLIQRALSGAAQESRPREAPLKPRVVQRPRAYELETIDPRLLLSGSLAIDLSAGDDQLVLNQTATGVSWSVNGGSFTDFASPGSIVINGLGGDDSLSLTFDSAAFGMLTADLSIFGGAGSDSLLLSGSLNLGAQALSAEAEDIQSLGTVGGAGSVSLTAVGDDDASVLVAGSIQASGAVVLSAQAGKSVALAGVGCRHDQGVHRGRRPSGAVPRSRRGRRRRRLGPSRRLAHPGL